MEIRASWSKAIAVIGTALEQQAMRCHRVVGCRNRGGWEEGRLERLAAQPQLFSLRQLGAARLRPSPRLEYVTSIKLKGVFRTPLTLQCQGQQTPRNTLTLPIPSLNMLTVHHLGLSQSERVFWLCEELGLEYELKIYKRSPLLAPPSLRHCTL